VAFATLATPWLRPRIMCYAWISSVGELRGWQDVEKPRSRFSISKLHQYHLAPIDYERREINDASVLMALIMKSINRGSDT